MTTIDNLLSRSNKILTEVPESTKEKTLNPCTAHLTKFCEKFCEKSSDNKNLKGNICYSCYIIKHTIINRKKSGNPSIIFDKNYTEKQAFDFLNMLDYHQVLKLSGFLTKEQEIKLNEIFKPENIVLYVERTEKKTKDNNLQLSNDLDNDYKEEHKYQLQDVNIEQKRQSIIPINNSNKAPALKIIKS